MRIEFEAENNFNQEAIADLFFESLPKTTKSDETLQPFTKPEMLQLFKKEIAEFWESQHFWLVKNDESSVGYLFVCSSKQKRANCTHDGQATIQEIYLLESLRGVGIEEKALNFVEDFCDERNLHLSFAVNPEWKLFEEQL